MLMSMNVLPQAGKQRGISLVELMIGMLLGLILLGGVILVFTSSSEVNRNRMAMSAISDNARFTLEHMNRHLRMAAPGSVLLSGDTLSATLISGNTIAYTLDTEAGEIAFDDGDGNTILVDGINNWQLLFGVGNRSANTLAYQDTAGASDEVWSIRANLILEDPSNQGNPLVIANNQVGSTIALRNPLLLAVADRDSEPLPGIGDPGTPADPETPPPVDDGNGDDTTTTPSEDGDAPDAGQPLPDQPVACEEQSLTVVVPHQHYSLTSQSLVAGQGAFLGCSDAGTTRTCVGRAAANQGFSMSLAFDRQGNHSTVNRIVDFSCVQ